MAYLFLLRVREWEKRLPLFIRRGNCMYLGRVGIDGSILETSYHSYLGCMVTSFR